ncbi:hypothetical protein MXB_3105, partial [Myxobolus squamalis]
YLGLTTVKFNNKLLLFNASSYTFNLFPACYLDNSPYSLFHCFQNGIPFMSFTKYCEFKNLIDLFPVHPETISLLFSTIKLKSSYLSIKLDIDEWLKKRPATTFTIIPKYDYLKYLYEKFLEPLPGIYISLIYEKL